MNRYWAFYWDTNDTNDTIGLYDVIDDAIEAIMDRHRECNPGDTDFKHAIGKIWDTKIGDFVVFAFPDRKAIDPIGEFRHSVAAKIADAIDNNIMG